MSEAGGAPSPWEPPIPAARFRVEAGSPGGQRKGTQDTYAIRVRLQLMGRLSFPRPRLARLPLPTRKFTIRSNFRLATAESARGQHTASTGHRHPRNFVREGPSDFAD